MVTKNATIAHLLRQREQIDKALKTAQQRQREALAQEQLQELRKAGLRDADAATLRAVLQAGQNALQARQIELGGEA